MKLFILCLLSWNVAWSTGQTTDNEPYFGDTVQGGGDPTEATTEDGVLVEYNTEGGNGTLEGTPGDLAQEGDGNLTTDVTTVNSVSEPVDSGDTAQAVTPCYAVDESGVNRTRDDQIAYLIEEYKKLNCEN